MPRRIFGRLLAAGLIAVASGMMTDGRAEAATAYVGCPLSVATKGLVRGGGTGWNFETVRSRLTGARVFVSGGRQMLECVYGAAGSVRRPAPRGMRCTAAPRGFSCTSSAPGPTPVLRRGEIGLFDGDHVDLDTGRRVPAGGLVDFGRVDLQFGHFGRSRVIGYYLRSAPRALISRPWPRSRGRSGCSRAAFLGPRDVVRLDRSLIGRYLCVRTAEGRIGEIRIRNYVGRRVGGGYVRLGYVVWRR